MNSPLQYPTILPSRKSYILISSIASIENDYLGKWVPENVSLKNPDGTLNQDAIIIESLPGYSCNKIPESLPEHLFIEINANVRKKCNEMWQPGIDGITPAPVEFEILSDRQLFFMQIKNIHGISSGFNRGEKGKISTNFKLHVVHRPTLCNYWHFELEITEGDTGKIIKKLDESGWRYVVASYIRTSIQDAAIFAVPDNV